jgi:hypothetical protein
MCPSRDLLNHHITMEKERPSRFPTRKDKAQPTLEMMSALAAILEGEKPPNDYLVLMTIKIWGYLTMGVVTKDHLLGSLNISEHTLVRSINRLRKYGWIAYDEQSEHLNVTKAGFKENFRLQGERSRAWKRFQDYSTEKHKEIGIKNSPFKKHEKDRQDD